MKGLDTATTARRLHLRDASLEGARARGHTLLPVHLAPMAHRLHGGMSPLDVVRSAEGERLKRALAQVVAADGAAEALLSLFVSGELGAAAGQAAFRELRATAGAEYVAALFALARREPPCRDFDLYTAARALPLVALMRHCGCAAAHQVEALVEDAGLETASDLVRYCAEDGGAFGEDAELSGLDGDDEEQLAALAMESGGALGRDALRAMLGEARALCAARAVRERRIGDDELQRAQPPRPAVSGEPTALPAVAVGVPVAAAVEVTAAVMGTRDVGC